MKLILSGHTYRYAAEQMLLMLFPGEPLISPEDGELPAEGEDLALTSLAEEGGVLRADTLLRLGGRTETGVASAPKAGDEEALRRQLLRQSIYRAALPFLPAPPAWGALSGVRPTKLVSRHLLAGGDMASADRLLEENYFVSPSRRKLCLEAASCTMEALSRQQAGDISLYVGIPFCPTRCIYCSFVSASVEKFGHLLPAYLEALEKEIAAAGDAVRRSGCRVRTLYIGGGTPTTLSAAQLTRLLGQLKEHFDLGGCLELTVEAGRPDTLDYEKLLALKAAGATRISINPQSMDDRVLAILGRSHSGKDILRAWDDACRAGHADVNMDLIAGLPGDSPEGFRRTLETVLSLGPTNITVHTLALKKAATLYYEKQNAALPDGRQVEEMLSCADTLLRGKGYHPYYLYRQKNMTGSFENVGWSLPGYDNLYNIYMMEELHTVLSLGSGGITKLISGRAIERHNNPKYPMEYIRNIDTICEEKRALPLAQA